MFYNKKKRAQRKAARALRTRQRRLKNKILQWSWMLFVLSEVGIFFGFTYKSGFDAQVMEDHLSHYWIVYLIPIALIFVVSTFADTISKELSNTNK